MIWDLTTIIVVAAIVLFAMLVIAMILAGMYKRASKEISFVRTGFGGQKVIMNGGALVFPVLHEIIKVNMNTMRLVVSRRNEQALITKDRMRVDATAEFYLRVKPEQGAIAFAAQTLGKRTMSPDDLKELMEGKFIDALRAVAAEMGMEELHEKRTDFVQRVQNAVTGDLEKNGLELETVSLTALDQTDKQFFNADNAFDAQGLTRLTETIESKRKVRNDIEQNTSVEIRRKNLEAEKERLELQKLEDFARATQQREIANQSAQEQANISSEKAANDRIASEAQIESQRQVETARIRADRQVQQERITNEQAVKEQDIEREKAVEIADQTRDIAIAEKSQERSRANKEAKVAEAEAVAAEEKVATARETEVANRNKQIAVIKATEQAEQEAVGIKVAAEARKMAAVDDADAVKTTAQAEADAVKIKAMADEERYRVEAEGQEKLNEAENRLSAEIIRMRVQLETIKNASGIVAAAVKPIESIEGMKIVNVGGLGEMVGGNGKAGGVGNGGNLGDQLIDGLLKYRGLAPVVDAILKEAGIDAGSLNGLTTMLTPTAGGMGATADTATEAAAVVKPVEKDKEKAS
ncbi:MAG: flotillin family protein [Chitinivibrionales bacterium]|nr:flotillin family protein [Chitinivibrionales bacterium]